MIENCCSGYPNCQHEICCKEHGQFPCPMCGTKHYDTCTCGFCSTVDSCAPFRNEVKRLRAENEALAEELQEQARLNGIGSEKEARLETENARLREALMEVHVQVLCCVTVLGDSESLRAVLTVVEEALTNIGKPEGGK